MLSQGAIEDCIRTAIPWAKPVASCFRSSRKLKYGLLGPGFWWGATLPLGQSDRLGPPRENSSVRIGEGLSVVLERFQIKVEDRCARLPYCSLCGYTGGANARSDGRKAQRRSTR